VPLRFGTAHAWAVRFRGCILLRPISMPRICSCMKTNFSRMTKGPILALLVTGFFIASRPSLCAEAGAGVIQANTSVRAPTLETLQRGLEDMLDRLNLTHAQREQVEQIMAGEALQLQMARGNPNLSVARVFAQEQAIRLQTRRQIASMLSPKQGQKVTELMTRRAVKLENRANDY
jgi:Spy/CpxP family protein refolding chaperone